MGEHRRLTYATKAKVEHARRMAELVGINEVGAIELGPDGTIRITAKASAQATPLSPDDEVAQWRAKRGRK